VAVRFPSFPDVEADGELDDPDDDGTPESAAPPAGQTASSASSTTSPNGGTTTQTAPEVVRRGTAPISTPEPANAPGIGDQPHDQVDARSRDPGRGASRSRAFETLSLVEESSDDRS
jgi:hypothetical protein